MSIMEYFFDHFTLNAELLIWEEWIRGFCIGFLIFGVLVVIVVLVTMGISTGHSLSHDTDLSVDKDISIDKDISVDKDISIDKDISLDKDFSLDKDVSIDKDLSIDKDISSTPELGIQTPDHVFGKFSTEKGSTAPLLLVVAVFSITFGGLGLLLFWQEPDMNKYGRIAVIILAPILLSIIVDRIWRKVAVSETYRLPTNKDYLGREAVVFVKVDSKGGTIRVEIPGQLEPLKVPAKTAHKHDEFLQDELVFIVGVEGNFYLIDNSRDLLTGKKHLSEDNELANEE
ncbi:MAG: hypothetical protein KGD59_15455 [Candidatus Heimdallarchaeota archaeon]|nr:hypothetical protein [Candidatus Heimdallarchaeota archaeon]MBY8995945.1 hypothetical protein [Candidatus Heimdallarchaeota archaeon]